MEESITYVGLDVHKDSIWTALARPNGEVIQWGRCENRPTAVRRLVGRLERKGARLEFVYEAGPCGYGLYRQLVSLGQVCQVVAPSLIPRRAGDRVKTDRRDAVTLARLARSGDLVGVWVPDEPHEAVRELVRCREDVKDTERRDRQRMNALLLRHGRHWDRDKWTQAHRRWLQGQRFAQSEAQAVFDHYLHAIQEAEERLVQIERQMREALETWSLSPLVDALMAMRGVKLVTAMTLAAELGDVTRFDGPAELMSYVGLTPSERSSGSTRRRGSITKSGNAHIRRVLIESCWSYRYRAAWTPAIRKRAARASEAIRAIAWKAQKRLHHRYHRLTLRGKRAQVAVTAVAREALGFVWAIGMQVAREQPSSGLARAI